MAWIPKVRKVDYLVGKYGGDVRAVQTNTVPRRVVRRVAGKVTGRLLGRLFG